MQINARKYAVNLLSGWLTAIQQQNKAIKRKNKLIKRLRKEAELISSGEQTAIVFAARYTHTRNTGGSSVIVNTILANWNRLSLETQKQLKREARNEATCNFDDWEKVLDR